MASVAKHVCKMNGCTNMTANGRGICTPCLDVEDERAKLQRRRAQRAKHVSESRVRALGRAACSMKSYNPGSKRYYGTGHNY